MPASRRTKFLKAIRDAGFVDDYRYVETGIFSEYCARKPL